MNSQEDAGNDGLRLSIHKEPEFQKVFLHNQTVGVLRTAFSDNAEMFKFRTSSKSDELFPATHTTI